MGDHPICRGRLVLIGNSYQFSTSESLIGCESTVDRVVCGHLHPSRPSISLPKGGGVIRAIGEKFAANPFTGPGSMSVPIDRRALPLTSGWTNAKTITHETKALRSPISLDSIPAIGTSRAKMRPSGSLASEPFHVTRRARHGRAE